MNPLVHVVDGGSGSPLSNMAERTLRYLMAHPNQIHGKDSVAQAVGFTARGRCLDTYIAEIRRALGDLRHNIVCAHGGRGYGWIGAAVALVPAVNSRLNPKRSEVLARHAVLTRAEVATRLGISERTVISVEKKALEKLRLKPELKKAWFELLSCHRRITYDPFREIWLFSVQSEC